LLKQLVEKSTTTWDGEREEEDVDVDVGGSDDDDKRDQPYGIKYKLA